MEATVSESIDPQLQSTIDNMPANTGKSLAEWFQIIAASGNEKHGDIMKLLKGDNGVSHGYANTISILYRQSLAGGPTSGSELIDTQYAGAKAALRPGYEAVLTTVSEFGPDVEIAPKKTYVSLRRSKQFASVKAATKSRVDLGLNLKGIEGSDRFEEGNAFGGMCTHLVRLTAAVEVDEEVREWLKHVYDRAQT
jgi:hypothetical protein